MRQTPGHNTIQPQPLPRRKSKPTKTHIIEVQDFTRASIDRGPLHTTYSVRKNGQPLTSRQRKHTSNARNEDSDSISKRQKISVHNIQFQGETSSRRDFHSSITEKRAQSRVTGGCATVELE